MAVGYSNLWKLLIDKHMNKSQLREAAKITQTQLLKWEGMNPSRLKLWRRFAMLCLAL